MDRHAGRRAHPSKAKVENLGHQRHYKKTGEMPERLKGHDWKSCEGLISLPRVRIPLSPPFQLPVFIFQFSVFGKTRKMRRLARVATCRSFGIYDQEAVLFLSDRKLKTENRKPSSYGLPGTGPEMASPNL
jgi:hypothetical protein